MEGKSVAVVIVNYNAGDLLKKCLACLAQQTVTPNKIIIFDNASDDGSIREIADLYPDILVIQSLANVGFAAANNQAARQAQECEWLALLNPDAFPEPTWLEELLHATTAYPTVTSFCSKMISGRDEQLLDGTGDMYDVLGRASRRNYQQVPAHDCDEAGEVFSACAASALYKHAVFNEVGGFDEDFFCYYEDVDLGFRMQLAGYNCRYVPKAVVYHMGSAISGLNSDFCLYYCHRNLIWAYIKNMPLLLLLLYLPGHILLNVLYLVLYSRQAQFRIVLKAKWDAIKGCVRMLRKRWAIQKTKKIKSMQLRKKMAHDLLAIIARKSG
jgi:GT2 family glycosyltransferase